MPLTFLAALISLENRDRNPRSSASSGRISLIATSRPPGDFARYTWPMPPAPSRPSSRYGPTDAGSPLFRSLITVGPPILAVPKNPSPTQAPPQPEKHDL